MNREAGRLQTDISVYSELFLPCRHFDSVYVRDLGLGKYGFTIGNPREDARRGGHVALEHEDAIRINEALKARGVVPDFRPPRVIRLAPVALYCSFTDVYDLVEILVDIMETKEYEKFSSKRGTVA